MRIFTCYIALLTKRDHVRRHHQCQYRERSQQISKDDEENLELQ
jgi:hypothetical protein